MWLSRSDLRYTLRQMGRKPGFVVLAALVLAGGLAVSLMAFTVCYTMFYKALPITNGERIVHVCAFPGGGYCAELRADDFARIRGEITSLENVGLYTERGVSLEYRSELWPDRAIATEWNLFRLSETAALLGRTLQAADQAMGAETVAVIGYKLWRQRFAGDPDIVGKILGIDRQQVRIVGVMPEGYAMPYSAQLWLPVAPNLLAPPDSMAPMPFVQTYALLEPGVSIEQASQEINALMARNRARFPAQPVDAYPSRYLGFLSTAATGHAGYFNRAMFGDGAAWITMFVMNALTLLVFLLACINVGALLLARINERMKDTSVRVALGASRVRLLVQICLESTLITLLGSALAVLLAGIGLEVVMLGVRSLGEGLLAFWMEPKVDASTLAGVVLYALLTIGLTAVLPGWRIINGDYNAAMRDGTRGALGLRSGRFSRGLVVTALMIVTLLLYLVTLTGSTLIPAASALTRTPANLVSGGVLLDSVRYGEEERQQFARVLTARMQEEPSIELAHLWVGLDRGRVEGEATATNEPVETSAAAWNAQEPGETDPRFSASVDASLAVRLLEGRTFTEADTAHSARVVTISAALAERLWPGESPIDKRLRIVDIAGVTEDWRRIVGVISVNATASFLADTNLESLALPLSQIDTAGRPFYVRAFASSAAGKSQVMQYLRDEFAAVATSEAPIVQDPATILTNIAGAFRTGVRLALLVGLFVFVVAIAGIYGLTQNTVLMATHEIGLRRALGARDGQIAKLFMKRAGRQVAKGFVGAMLICAPVTLLFFLMAQEFSFDAPFGFGVSVAVVGLLYAAVMLATWLPVRRILRMEPGEALRYE